MTRNGVFVSFTPTNGNNLQEIHFLEWFNLSSSLIDAIFQKVRYFRFFVNVFLRFFNVRKKIWKISETGQLIYGKNKALQVNSTLNKSNSHSLV